MKAINGTSKSVTPKNGSTSTSPMPDVDDTVEPEEYMHDFTDCCKSFNVSTKCLGFCTIHNIIDGTAGVEPDVCETDFPRIVKCMADGRNHLPCCERKNIPDVCQVNSKLINQNKIASNEIDRIKEKYPIVSIYKESHCGYE